MTKMIGVFKADEESCGKISPYKNPFLKACFSNAHIHIYSPGALWSGNDWSISGTLEFKNGNTKGEQEFRGKSLDELIKKMALFVENLE